MTLVLLLPLPENESVNANLHPVSTDAIHRSFPQNTGKSLGKVIGDI
jgi:hypothetical protein